MDRNCKVLCPHGRMASLQEQERIKTGLIIIWPGTNNLAHFSFEGVKIAKKDNILGSLFHKTSVIGKIW